MNVYEISSVEDRIRGNSYVGRGIVIGKTEDGKKACSAYFISRGAGLPLRSVGF